jgi:hypothetical protein
MTNSKYIDLLIEFKETPHNEHCRNFDPGINAIIRILSENPLSDSNEWREATSMYRTMTGTKSGFSDVYIDRDTVEQRVVDNARLDAIRKVLWDTSDRS